MRITTLLGAIVLYLYVASFVSCHFPIALELQRIRITNFQDSTWFATPTEDEDYSFEHPLDIVQRTSFFPSAGDPRAPKIRTDAAITARATLLEKRDYDVFLFDKPNNDPHLLHVYVMATACRELRNFYPALTFLAPAGTMDSLTNTPLVSTDFDPDDLPFDVPAGYGVKTILQERARHGQRRPMWCGLDRLFYPFGAEECPEAPTPTCDYTNILRAQIDAAAKYYYVVWHPQFRYSRRTIGPFPRRYDYALIRGLVEIFRDLEPEESAAFRERSVYGGGRQVTTRCTQPYSPVICDVGEE
mmetsp:Transcript_2727/g.3064  ORF Transcript_2727/g.3064 Transcript_2727/m.3064 type:complete len:301 (-) Transcript_2727:94-996(-)|eukprot:CAMPEP_0168514376 /NCGR_PEP_ID=MMETSP0405-20121227/4073_1 /TAXON_ID=498012 /ORGANISM="Trichosphaerium sp, Strain Am-I-7 wt" /LENGTH=300 /DNA_ID=CAMNT_0008533491 /DNA_START=12 /DNA_END=914 /DNA_ORIENTATION=+